MVAGLMVSGVTELTAARMLQLRSNVRRTILMSAGRKAAKIIKKKLKDEPKGEATGLLQKSIVAKVKSYARNNTVFVIGGVKSNKTEVDKYKDYRTGQMRMWKRPRRGGPKVQDPAKYVHLAGPRRKGLFVKNVAQSTFKEVQQVIIETIEREVMRR